MPKIHLTPNFVSNPPKSAGKAKVDYFDIETPGFLLEVRVTGKSTYYQRYRDTSGRLKQFRIGPVDSVSLEDARNKAKKIRSQASMGLDPRKNLDRLKEIPTFKDFVNQKYLPFVQVQKRSWEADKTMLENRIIKLWGHKRLTEITRDDIEEFRGNFIRAGFKPGTANRYLALVKYIFNLAVKWEVIDKNPTINVQKLKDNNHKERYLTEDETRRLLDELKKCQSNVVPDIIEFLILTGARRSEVVNLPWSELDMENGIWSLPPERNKANTKKIVPLSEGAMDILKRRQGNDSDYVFPNPKTGEPFIFLHGTWDRIRKKAGIPDVRLHDLRHNFASLLINNGRSLYEVQKMLGHSDAKTTERYAHLTQDTLKEATEIVSRSVRGENITKAK